jgi:two-component system chemotaxis response regulator CheY
MKTILIVDDSQTMRRMVKISLKAFQDVELKEAGNGLEALECLALEKIDLVILDLNMPDMHGKEVLEFVRKHLFSFNIPIVVLTTRGDEESRKTILEAGASSYLTKPCPPEVLATTVQKLLGLPNPG